MNKTEIFLLRRMTEGFYEDWSLERLNRLCEELMSEDRTILTDWNCFDYLLELMGDDYIRLRVLTYNAALMAAKLKSCDEIERQKIEEVVALAKEQRFSNIIDPNYEPVLVDIHLKTDREREIAINKEGVNFNLKLNFN